MSAHSPQGFAVLPSCIARDPSIEPILKTLLLALSSFAGADQSCYPSNKTLQECTGLSERTVREWVSIGAERGLLVVHRRVLENGAPATNLYALNFSKWGDLTAKQTARGVPADYAGGVGRHAAPGGAPPCPRWGATAPPNNTREQDQENKTRDHSTPLPAVAAPTPASKQPKLLDEPQVNLVDEYNRLCPSLAKVQGKPGSAAAKTAVAAWKREPDLAAWRQRFERVERSDFLTYRNPKPGDRPFKADLLWILSPTNAEKIDSGRYDNRKAPPMMRVGNVMMPVLPSKSAADEEPDVEW